MRVATIDNRLCVIRPEGAVDIATVTGGEFPADPAGLMARWDDFRAWAAAHAAELEAAPAAEYQSADLDAPVPCPSQIFAIGKQGKPLTDVVVVPPVNPVISSVTANADGSITVTPDGGTAPYSFAWSTGADEASVNGLAAGTYTVTITDANGCSITLSFTLDQPMDVVMPTGFTPNGDGSNDSYVVQGLEAYPDNRIIIYNRWGNVVYDRVRYTNDWSGENQQGEPLPNGTYFVVLTLTPDGAPMQNYVDLRR